jgi:hypothetical protein
VIDAAAPLNAGRRFLFASQEISMTEKTDQTRRLNDLARTRPETVNASWVMTQGVLHLMTGDEDAPDATARAVERVTALRAAIAQFSDWDEGNDPYGEHDFGAFDLLGERLFFKIDYYHPDHDTHAPVPSNIELCRRVLTVMRADEY